MGVIRGKRSGCQPGHILIKSTFGKRTLWIIRLQEDLAILVDVLAKASVIQYYGPEVYHNVINLAEDAVLLGCLILFIVGDGSID